MQLAGGDGDLDDVAGDAASSTGTLACAVEAASRWLREEPVQTQYAAQARVPVLLC